MMKSLRRVHALTLAGVLAAAALCAPAAALAAPTAMPITVRGVDAEPGPIAVASVQVSTTARIAPALPETVFVSYSDGSTRSVAVAWADIAASQYAEPGRFSVEGRVDGISLVVTAAVTVTQAEQVRAAAVNLTVGSVAAGGGIAVSGANFATPIDGADRGGPVGVWLSPGALQLGTVAVADERTFALSVVIPAGTTPGEYRLRAVQDGVETVSEPFVVRAAARPTEPPAVGNTAAPLPRDGAGATPPGAGSEGDPGGHPRRAEVPLKHPCT